MYVPIQRRVVDTDFNDPITTNELKRLPPLPYKNAMRFFNVLAGIEWIFTIPNLCFIPFAHWLWRIPTLLAAADMISREVENGTWVQVATTPYSVREVIKAKYAAIFRYMEEAITIITYLRLLPVVILAIIWTIGAIIILPNQGFDLWIGNTVALVLAGIYLVISPSLDVALDGAIGLLASVLSVQRSTAGTMALLIRTVLWLLPMAIAVPIQYDLVAPLGLLQTTNLVAFKSWAIVLTFGPGYAYAWNINPWLSALLVIVAIVGRIGISRLLIEATIYRAERMLE